MKNYKIIEQIGHGAYCIVYKAYDIPNKKYVAIKRIIYPFKKIQDKLLNQMGILKKFNSHPNIIKLIQTIVTQNDQLYFIFELEDTTLIEHYKACKQIYKRALHESEIKTIVFQICLALEALHTNNIMHRDIKPQNIMFAHHNKVIKLIDFGFAKYNTSDINTQYISTRWYRSPEILLQMKYGIASDIFSLGCIILELYNGVQVFRGRNNIDQFHKILEVLGNIEDWQQGIKKLVKWGINIQRSINDKRIGRMMQNISPEGRNLIQQMLQYNPKKRIKIQDILKHKYFNSLILPLQINEFLKQQKIQKQSFIPKKLIDVKIPSNFIYNKTEQIYRRPIMQKSVCNINQIPQTKYFTNGFTNNSQKGYNIPTISFSFSSNNLFKPYQNRTQIRMNSDRFNKKNQQKQQIFSQFNRINTMKRPSLFFSPTQKKNYN